MSVDEAINVLLESVGNLSIDEKNTIIETPDGAKALAAIIVAEKKIELVKDAAKAIILEHALKLDPNFKAVQVAGVRCTYQNTGSMYRLADPARALQAGVARISLDASAIKEWKERNPEDALPDGVEPVEERSKSLVIGISTKKA